MQAELAHDIPAVNFDRRNAYVEASGNARRTAAVAHQSQNFALTIAERLNLAKRSAARAIKLGMQRARAHAIERTDCAGRCDGWPIDDQPDETRQEPVAPALGRKCEFVKNCLEAMRFQRGFAPQSVGGRLQLAQASIGNFAAAKQFGK